MSLLILTLKVNEVTTMPSLFTYNLLPIVSFNMKIICPNDHTNTMLDQMNSVVARIPVESSCFANPKIIILLSSKQEQLFFNISGQESELISSFTNY